MGRWGSAKPSQPQPGQPAHWQDRLSQLQAAQGNPKQPQPQASPGSPCQPMASLRKPSQPRKQAQPAAAPAAAAAPPFLFAEARASVQTRCWQASPALADRVTRTITTPRGRKIKPATRAITPTPAACTGTLAGLNIAGSCCPCARARPGTSRVCGGGSALGKAAVA